MEIYAATHERTRTEPPAAGLTPELIKLVEEAQVPCYPGCKYTVHKFIDKLMDMELSEPNATGGCILEIVWLYIPYMPRGGEIWQFAGKIDKLIYACTLIRSLKSHGGNAESSSNAATSGNKIRWNFQPTIVSSQQSELVPNATGGNFFMRDSIQDGDPQLQQNLQPTLSLFPQRSEQICAARTGRAKGKISLGDSFTPQ